MRAVMSDSGSCYLVHEYRRCLGRSSVCATYGSSPGRPRTNGKAERFIQKLLNEWAYAQIYVQLRRASQRLSRSFSGLYNFRATTRLPRQTCTGLETEQPRWDYS